jgi:hypothetical protein
MAMQRATEADGLSLKMIGTKPARGAAAANFRPGEDDICMCHGVIARLIHWAMRNNGRIDNDAGRPRSGLR